MRAIILYMKKGWKHYVEPRFQPIVKNDVIKVEPHQFDGLSFPMTLVQIL